MHRYGGAALAALMVLLSPAAGRAFTTRVHIVLSNEIRAALIESGDGTIELRWSDHAVRIPREDADAIINQPLAFRAGAVGPDNVVFPAMTDGTHAVDQDPFRQCELLYADAFTEAERAYALGCFLHGATDAIAHHFVNFFTGETFTLNPLSANRESSYDNVVGHIVTESVIQSAFYAADSSAFGASQLEHEMQQDFVLRTYFNVDHAVWQRMTVGSRAKWADVQSRFPRPMATWPPQSNLLTWIQNAGFHPWEQIAMAPVYIDEIQSTRTDLRAQMDARRLALAADPRLMVRPGPDGELGTPDDDVSGCSATCLDLYGEYYLLVRLLAPRFDTRGNPLPSAFDKISDDLGDRLYGFLPAFVGVIQNLSTQLNSPITDDGEHGLDIDRSTFPTVFAPVTDWAAVAFAIDWETVGRAVSPQWYTEASDFLAMFGIRVTIPDIISMIFQPIIDQIRDALMQEVRMRAEVFVDELKAEYDRSLAPWQGSVDGRLGASAPPGLGGHALDYLRDAGLFAHAFNITAVALANHEVLLVDGMEVATGPASFDASYTPEWSQLGQCDYLREATFPHGLGLVPLLSVEREDGTYYASPILDNSPIECHAGALSEFGAPGSASCAHTTLDELVMTRFGSITRAYPPAYAGGMPGCRRLRVPGLPDPPPIVGEDGGTPGGDAGGNEARDGSVDAGPGVDAGGCGCRSAGRPGASVPLALLFGLLVLVARRRARGCA